MCISRMVSLFLNACSTCNRYYLALITRIRVFNFFCRSKIIVARGLLLMNEAPNINPHGVTVRH